MTPPVRTSASLLCLLLLSLAASCSKSSSKSGEETKVIRYEGTAGNVAYVELAEDLGLLGDLKLDYVGNNSTGGPHSIQAVTTGDIDIGSSFNGAIIKLVAGGAPIRSLVASYGTDAKTISAFYVLEDSPIRSARDLIGKRVAINTLGAHAEFSLKDYLARNGLSNEEIAQVAMVPLPAVNAEVALREKQIEAACLSQVFRHKALERKGIRQLFSDYETFGEFTAGSYVMSKRFITANPNTVRKFVQGVGAAIDWANAQPRDVVAERMRQIIEKRGRNENDQAVTYWQSPGVTAKRGALTDRDFQMWIDWMVKDGQLKPGQLEPTDVYTNEFNKPEPTASR